MFVNMVSVWIYHSKDKMYKEDKCRSVNKIRFNVSLIYKMREEFDLIACSSMQIYLIRIHEDKRVLGRR